jgi:hypothetical protein
MHQARKEKFKGWNNHYRCKCCYKKHNQRRIGVPWEKTTKEQKYYKLWEGGEIKEDNGKDHTSILEGTNY